MHSSPTPRHVFTLTVGRAIAAAAALFAATTAAGAAGISRTDPLYYGGLLADGRGMPLASATVNLTITLWDKATAGTKTLCYGPKLASLTQGRFRVALDTACVTVIKSKSDLWLEVTADSATLPRVKVSAAPYAVEAERAQNGVPVGTIVPYGGSIITKVPDGWLLCDGRTLDSTTDKKYADLFAAIGTLYGGTGASSFDLPKLTDTFIKGQASIGEKIGDSGGKHKNSHAHQVTSKVAVNNHSVTWPTYTTPGHAHQVGKNSSTGRFSMFNSKNQTLDAFTLTSYGQKVSSNQNGFLVEFVNGNSKLYTAKVNATTCSRSGGAISSHSVSNTATSSGLPSDTENRPKYVVVNFIIKY